MGDFDDLRKHAANILGPDVARRLEKELGRQVDGSKDDRAELVHVERVTFPGSGLVSESAPLSKFVEQERESLDRPKSVDPEAGSHPKPHADPPLVLPSHPSAPERLVAQAIRGEYLYGAMGLALGLASILGGVVLGLNGVAGSTSWTASLLGLQSKINDAAPGVVLFVVGIFFVWATRPKVKLRDLK